MSSVILVCLSGSDVNGIYGRAGKKYGRKAIVNAHQLLDKEMYISCITLSMAPDPDTGAMGVTW